eukprot:scpid107477/ scgid29156/ 
MKPSKLLHMDESHTISGVTTYMYRLHMEESHTSSGVISFCRVVRSVFFLAHVLTLTLQADTDIRSNFIFKVSLCTHVTVMYSNILVNQVSHFAAFAYFTSPSSLLHSACTVPTRVGYGWAGVDSRNKNVTRPV